MSLTSAVGVLDFKVDGLINGSGSIETNSIVVVKSFLVDLVGAEVVSWDLSDSATSSSHRRGGWLCKSKGKVGFVCADTIFIDVISVWVRSNDQSRSLGSWRSTRTKTLIISALHSNINPIRNLEGT